MESIFALRYVLKMHRDADRASNEFCDLESAHHN